MPKFLSKIAFHKAGWRFQEMSALISLRNGVVFMIFKPIQSIPKMTRMSVRKDPINNLQLFQDRRVEGKKHFFLDYK